MAKEDVVKKWLDIVGQLVIQNRNWMWQRCLTKNQANIF
jgi:hypothetical protein